MIVDDLDVVRVAVHPTEADAPLVVHPDTVQASTISAQFLKSITWGQPKILELHRRVDETELPEHHAPEVGREAADRLALPEPFGVAISEAPNHAWIITLRVTIRKGEPGLVKLTRM